jgi:hypothetical protein
MIGSVLRNPLVPVADLGASGLKPLPARPKILPQSGFCTIALLSSLKARAEPSPVRAPQALVAERGRLRSRLQT